MYKRMASALSLTELDDLKAEMIDRFGTLPKQLVDLFRITALKLAAIDLGLARIDFGTSGGRIEFRADTRVDPIALVRMVQSEPNTYRLEGATKLRVTRAVPDVAARFELVEKLLERLRPRDNDADRPARARVQRAASA
jgi:transcription-repair coupling factor (superfamily II helicase)